MSGGNGTHDDSVDDYSDDNRKVSGGDGTHDDSVDDYSDDDRKVSGGDGTHDDSIDDIPDGGLSLLHHDDSIDDIPDGGLSLSHPLPSRGGHPSTTVESLGRLPPTVKRFLKIFAAIKVMFGLPRRLVVTFPLDAVFAPRSPCTHIQDSLHFPSCPLGIPGSRGRRRLIPEKFGRAVTMVRL